MDDLEPLHLVGKLLLIDHADTGEREHRVVGKSSALAEARSP